MSIQDTPRCPYLDEMGHCLTNLFKFCQALDVGYPCIEIRIVKSDGTIQVIENKKWKEDQKNIKIKQRTSVVPFDAPYTGRRTG